MRCFMTMFDPNKCPGCRRSKIACICPGGGGSEDDDTLEGNKSKTQDKTNSRLKPQLTPFKLVLLPNEKKIAKEHLENSECYEIKAEKTPQEILDFFNAYLKRLAAVQHKTIAGLTD